MEKKYCAQCSQGLIPTMQFCPKCGGRSFASQPASSGSQTQTFFVQNSPGPQISTPNNQWQQSSGHSPSYGKAMSLPAAVSTCIRKYFTVNGRAQRSEFWWFYASYVVAVYASSFLMGISDSFSLLFLSVFVGGIIPSVTVAVRRLHDLDHSGWWYLTFYIPLVGGLLMLVWFCGRGTIGDNRFGPDPLAQDPQGIVNAQII